MENFVSTLVVIFCLLVIALGIFFFIKAIRSAVRGETCSSCPCKNSCGKTGKCGEK